MFKSLTSLVEKIHTGIIKKDYRCGWTKTGLPAIYD